MSTLLDNRFQLLKYSIYHEKAAVFVQLSIVVFAIRFIASMKEEGVIFFPRRGKQTTIKKERKKVRVRRQYHTIDE